MQGDGHSNGRPQGKTAPNPLKQKNNQRDVKLHFSCISFNTGCQIKGFEEHFQYLFL